MTETVHSSRPELHDPSRFLADALHDARRSPPIAAALFRSTTVARYRRSGLGYVWLLLPTLATVALAVYVRAMRIVAQPPSELPYPVYVFAGTVLWQVFAESLNSPLQQLSAHRQLLTRSRVPVEALFLAGMFEVLLNGAVRLVALGAVVVAHGVPVGVTALLVPLGLATLALLGMAFGLLVAPIGVLYEDVGRTITLVTGFWFFLTPVVYHIPREGFLWLNPVTPLLETTRGWLTSAGTSPGFAVTTGLAVGLLVLAWLLQRLARPHVIARLG